MATRGSRDPQRSLQESVDRLAGAFDKMAERLEAVESGGYRSDGDRLTRHIRRYMPFYALATIWALMIVLLPTRQAAPPEASQLGALTPGGTQSFDGFSGTTDGLGAAPGDTGGTPVRGASVQAGGAAQGEDGPTPVPEFDPLAWTATGKTKGGFDCEPGVRQIPWSRYAVPCFPAWEGDNGGATTRGVSADEIIVVERRFGDSANAQAVDTFVQAAGFASTEEIAATREAFEEYFNSVFELWGRKVTVIEYRSEYGDSTLEAQSRGKEGACADADSIIAKHQPYMVIGAGATAPFGECAAERQLVVFGAGAYYPETWYRKYSPYLWNGVMECERIGYMNAEYIGKRLWGRPAKWAKGLLEGRTRKLGLYVPNNAEYQHCVNIAERVGKERYGSEIASRYNYVLDVSRFPDEAGVAITRFNADGVTTVILACDPISPIFLTQAAKAQNYYPEWITNSAGLTDVDQFARLWDQQTIQWSLFGMSQLGDLGRILGPEGEGTITYKRATGTDIPPGAQTVYYGTLGMFSALQAAGPILMPETMANGIWRLPPGGAPEFEVGYTHYGTGPDGGPGRDHTGVDDMREVYWLCTNITTDLRGASLCAEPKGPDGVGGMYVATYGGRRFLPEQWPAEDPPVFPEKP